MQRVSFEGDIPVGVASDRLFGEWFNKVNETANYQPGECVERLMSLRVRNVKMDVLQN